MLTLLVTLTSANAAIPVPTVDGDQAVACADGVSLSTIIHASGPTGKAGSTLHDLVSQQLVDVTQPLWATSSKRHNALYALSFTMAAGVNPTVIAHALPDNGVYTLQGQVIEFKWAHVAPAKASTLDVMSTFEATNGCLLAQAGAPDQTGGFWVHEGGLRVEARLPKKVIEKSMTRLGIPMTAHASASIPLDASTTEPVAMAMRVNMNLSTQQLNSWLELAKVSKTLDLDLPMQPGSQIGLVGTPSEPGLVGTVRLQSKKNAKELYKALVSEESKPDEKRLLAAIDGPRVFFATSPILLADVSDPAAGTPWFTEQAQAPMRPESDPGVFVRLRNGAENVDFAILMHQDGHLRMVADGPKAVDMMRWM